MSAYYILRHCEANSGVYTSGELFFRENWSVIARGDDC
jgi:hypothetical protein